ncbi:MAG: MFS transporter [Candidatus Obscuribacterales bacterium]
MSDTTARNPQSMWAPLTVPVFRALWLASTFSNIGTFMQDVGAAWLMTSLTISPVMVSLMQTATYLPFFMLSLPAGALADLVDRRRLLIVGQSWMLVAAFGLACLTFFHIVGPWWLLTFTFMLGIGNAISAPAWNASTPELVPRDKLEPAIALGGLSYNTSRGVGSALGGLIVAAAGPAAVFFLNALSFLAVIYVVAQWQHKPNEQGERIFGAMRAGVRYVRHSPALVSVMIRSGVFAGTSASMWALLPLIGREQIRCDSITYGLLLSVFGVGCIVGAFSLPIMRRRLSLDHLNLVGNLLFAISLVILAFSHHFLVACCAMLDAGAAWIIVNSSMNAAAQMATPSWVRARAMSVYILVFQGSVAVGSLLWGQIACFEGGLPLALGISAICMCVNFTLAMRFKLSMVEGMDTSMSSHWRDPNIVHEPDPDNGPVLVTVEYVIDPARAKEFTEAANILGRVRRRDGAYQWHLFFDLARPERCFETFMIESWGEHVRQHERVMISDKVVEDKVNSFHVGERPPIVHHLLSANSAEPIAIPAQNPLRH